jgi:hypothetical protein
MASLALLRVHVLVVELPGRPMLRLRAEAAVRARGWVLTAEPEDSDLVLVCGTPRPEIAAAVDGIWSRVPVPRVRRTVRAADDLPGALDSAARVLADDALQRRAAADAPAPPPPAPPTRLGPFGPLWPSGLVVDSALDRAGRVAAVGARRIRAEHEEDQAEARDLLLTVADAARLLRLAGWPAPAQRLDRVVDLGLAGEEPARLRRRVRGVAGTVGRSATLRWVLLRAAPDVDVRARVVALLQAAIDGDGPPAPSPRVLVGQPAGALPLLVAATEPVPSDG